MLTVSDQTLGLLPSSLKELAELIGIEACLTLVDRFGGSRLYVPKSVPELHKLSCLGSEAINNLVGIFGGNFLQIPCASSLKKWIRNNEIAEARQVSTVAKIAREFNLTERQIWTILKKMRDNATEVNSEFIT